MGRVVYSFSVPQSSVANWELRKWRAAEVKVSHMIQKLIEGDGTQVLHLEKELENQRRIMARQSAVLEILGTNAADWILRTRNDGSYHVHASAISESHADYIIKKAINIREFHSFKTEEG